MRGTGLQLPVASLRWGGEQVDGPCMFYQDRTFADSLSTVGLFFE